VRGLGNVTYYLISRSPPYLWNLERVSYALQILYTKLIMSFYSCLPIKRLPQSGRGFVHETIIRFWDFLYISEIGKVRYFEISTQQF